MYTAIEQYHVPYLIYWDTLLQQCIDFVLFCAYPRKRRSPPLTVTDPHPHLHDLVYRVLFVWCVV